MHQHHHHRDDDDHFTPFPDRPSSLRARRSTDVSLRRASRSEILRRLAAIVAQHDKNLRALCIALDVDLAAPHPLASPDPCTPSKTRSPPSPLADSNPALAVPARHRLGKLSPAALRLLFQSSPHSSLATPSSDTDDTSYDSQLYRWLGVPDAPRSAWPASPTVPVKAEPSLPLDNSTGLLSPPPSAELPPPETKRDASYAAIFLDGDVLRALEDGAAVPELGLSEHVPSAQALPHFERVMEEIKRIYAVFVGTPRGPVEATPSPSRHSERISPLAKYSERASTPPGTPSPRRARPQRDVLPLTAEALDLSKSTRELYSELATLLLCQAGDEEAWADDLRSVADRVQALALRKREVALWTSAAMRESRS